MNPSEHPEPQFQVINLTGRLVREPELHRHEDGSSVCVIRLAVDGMGRGGRDQTGYINVLSFGKSGEAAANHLSAGRLVSVSGRLQHETWTARDRSTRESYSVVGHVEFLAAPARGAGHADPGHAIEREAEPVTPF